MALPLPLFYKRSRIIGIAVVLTTIVFATLYGFWPNWQLGASFGHRGFIELLPIVAIGFAVAIQDTRWKISVVLGAGILSLLAVVLMLAYWRGAVPFSDTTKLEYWNALLGRHLKSVEKALLLTATMLMVLACLAPQFWKARPIERAAD